MDAENCRHPSCPQFWLHYCLQCNTIVSSRRDPRELLSAILSTMLSTMHCFSRAHFLTITFSLPRSYHFLTTTFIFSTLSLSHYCLSRVPTFSILAFSAFSFCAMPTFPDFPLRFTSSRHVALRGKLGKLRFHRKAIASYDLSRQVTLLVSRW